MSRKSDRELIRKHLYLEQSQWDRLEFYFSKNVGISAAVRAVLDNYLAKLDAKANASARPLSSETPNDPTTQDHPGLDELLDASGQPTA